LVFSEGKSLTVEDEKTYWGKISDGDEEDNDSAEGAARVSDVDTSSSPEERRLLVTGSVIYGYGLEPQPVGRFIMTETSESSEMYDEDDDDDEEDESEDDANGFSDWSNSFQ
jgi:hypothetical protein